MFEGDDLAIWTGFPHDLTKLSAEQVGWCVAYHAALPLVEIHRRQELIHQANWHGVAAPKRFCAQ